MSEEKQRKSKENKKESKKIESKESKKEIESKVETENKKNRPTNNNSNKTENQKEIDSTNSTNSTNSNNSTTHKQYPTIHSTLTQKLASLNITPTNKSNSLLQTLTLADKKYGTNLHHKITSKDVNTYNKMSWEELKVNKILAEQLREHNFLWPSPVQKEVLCRGSGDMVVRSKNGTGKTLAYLIPIINDWMKLKESESGEGNTERSTSSERSTERSTNLTERNIPTERHTIPTERHTLNTERHTLNTNPYTTLSTIILVPTRELALQVSKVSKSLSPNHILLPSYGGTNPYEDILRIKSGVHGLISTPGRILDLIERKVVKVDSINSIIFDEADKLLSFEYKKCVDKIIHSIFNKNKKCIKLFSATFPLPVNAFVSKYMNNPLFINLMKENYLLNYTQFYCNVEENEKLNCLVLLIKKLIFNQLIIFVNTSSKAERLAEYLIEMGYSCYYIHGKMAQEERNRVYHGFVTQMERMYRNIQKDKNVGNYVQILISTDLSTRGIDVPNLNLVINFDFPFSIESYIHRIGRAGRFGSKGISISFVTKEESRMKKAVEGKIGREMRSVGEGCFKEFCV